MEKIEKNTNTTEVSDEIDLSELLKSLNRGILLIFIIVLLCSFTGFYYAYFLAIPKYEATATFNLKDAKKTSLDLGELDSLAELSGLTGSTYSSENVIDQVNGADFLRRIVQSEELYLDQEFFKNPKLKKETWLQNKKNNLKQLLGVDNKKQTLNQKEIVNATIKQLAESFTIGKTKNGAYELSFASNNGAKAAFLANSLMNNYLNVREEYLISSNQRFLSYLEETLKNSKKELDEATDKIEAFMLARNMLSEREFTLQAGRLKDFREKVKNIEKTINELEIFDRFMSETTHKSQEFKLELNKLFSLAPQLRSLAFNKSNGELSNLELVLKIIRELIPEEINRRKKSLNATTIGYEKLASRAKRSALDARELSELSRDAQAKHLIFESVAKQVGANQINDGFQESLGEIYQTAIEPLNPIKPKKSLILAISAVLGIFLGSAISLTLSALSKKIWTVRKLQSHGLVNNISVFNNNLYHNLLLKNKFSIEKARRKSKSDAFKLNKLCFHLNQLASKPCQKNKFLCLIDFGQKPLIGIAPILGTVLSDSGKRVMLLDVTFKNSLSRSLLVKEHLKNKSEFLLSNVAYERLAPPLDSSQYVEFRKNIESLKMKYGQSHDYIITIVDRVENENVSMLELFTHNTLLFLTKAGQLSEHNISSIRSIINEKAEDSVFIIFFNK